MFRHETGPLYGPPKRPSRNRGQSCHNQAAGATRATTPLTFSPFIPLHGGGEWLVTGAQESVPEERGFVEEGRGKSWPLDTFSLPKCQEPPAGMVCS